MIPKSGYRFSEKIMLHKKAYTMTRRRMLLIAALAALVAMPAAAQDAQPRRLAVATTSIIADLVRNVGGDRVEVRALVGANGDAHVYSPTPGDAREIAAAAIVFVNGLGLEGWLTRLVTASGSKAPVVTLTKGVPPRRMPDEHHPGKTMIDPHAWQSIADAKIYVANIRDALAAVDDQEGDPVVATLPGRLDGRDDEVRAHAVGDVRLLAVDYPAAVDAFGARAQPGHV